MIEARIFLDSLKDVEEILAKQEYEFRGNFKITDEIYRSKDPSKPLSDDLLRLRVIPKNIWNTKDVIISVKQTNLKDIGKESKIPLKLEFDNVKTARSYLKQKILDDYKYDFTFSRTGRQYILSNGDVVDLEIIEGKPSVEFKSGSEQGIKDLLELFNIPLNKILVGPCIVGVKNILDHN